MSNSSLIKHSLNHPISVFTVATNRPRVTVRSFELTFGLLEVPTSGVFIRRWL